LALVAIAQNVESPDDYASAYIIRKDMERAGFTNIAATLATASLLRKGFTTMDRLRDESGEFYVAYKLEPSGFTWLEANEASLELRRGDSGKKSSGSISIGDEDIPF
jgi:hypothetical protein